MHLGHLRNVFFFSDNEWVDTQKKINGTFGKVHTRRRLLTGKEEINKLNKVCTESPLKSNCELTFKFTVFIESSEVISFGRDQTLNKVQFAIYT